MSRAWRAQAACIDTGDLMFPDPGDRRSVTEAKRVCAGCPVMEVCLADAMDDEHGRSKANRFGIRGGLDTGQRYAKYRRQVPAPAIRRPPTSGKPLAPCGTQGAYDRHLRRGEPVDDACRKAHADRRREDRARARENAPCGTVAGYQRHRRYAEDACAECREANRVNSAVQRARRAERKRNARTRARIAA
jgi:hypothetical protein